MAMPEEVPIGDLPLEPIYGRLPVGRDITSEELDRWFMDGLGGYEKDWRNADTDQRAAAKHQIALELSRRTGVAYDDVSRFIHQWAETSNDTDMRSLAIQRDAAELFGMTLSDYTREKIADVMYEMQEAIDTVIQPGYRYAGQSREAVMAAWQQEGKFLQFFPLMPSEQQKSLMTAMKDYTHEEMERLGFGLGDTIRLRRGISLPRDVVAEWSVGDTIPIEGNALESWSVGEDIARRFTYNPRGHGVILEMDVPVSMIAGSSRTGFGCLIEGEFVLQGLPSDAKLIWMQQ